MNSWLSHIHLRWTCWSPTLESRETEARSGGRSVEVMRLSPLNPKPLDVKEDVEVQTAAATALEELGLTGAQTGTALQHHDHGSRPAGT